MARKHTTKLKKTGRARLARRKALVHETPSQKALRLLRGKLAERDRIINEMKSELKTLRMTPQGGHLTDVVAALFTLQREFVNVWSVLMKRVGGLGNLNKIVDIQRALVGLDVDDVAKQFLHDESYRKGLNTGKRLLLDTVKKGLLRPSTHKMYAPAIPAVRYGKNGVDVAISLGRRATVARTMKHANKASRILQKGTRKKKVTR